MSKMNRKIFSITSSGDGKNRDKLTRHHDYIALITTDFCQNDKCIGELRDAYAMKLPMYAIVKRGNVIPKWILKIPWRKIIYFNNDRDIPQVANNLMKELLGNELRN